MRIWIPAAVTALSVAACAPAPDTGPDIRSSDVSRCFFSDRVINFAAESSTKIYLRSQRGDVYELTGSGGCSDVDFASALSVAPISGVSNRICIGEDARVQPLSAGPQIGPTLCRFTVNKVLTTEEVAALPSGSRP